MNEPAKSTIAEALRRYRYIAHHHRYGGMAHDYELAQRALKALDAMVEVRQMGLMGGNDEPRRVPGT